MVLLPAPALPLLHVWTVMLPVAFPSPCLRATDPVSAQALRLCLSDGVRFRISAVEQWPSVLHRATQRKNPLEGLSSPPTLCWLCRRAHCSRPVSHAPSGPERAVHSGKGREMRGGLDCVSLWQSPPGLHRGIDWRLR